jgi:hypothetical protein
MVRLENKRVIRHAALQLFAYLIIFRLSWPGFCGVAILPYNLPPLTASKISPYESARRTPLEQAENSRKRPPAENGRRMQHGQRPSVKSGKT